MFKEIMGKNKTLIVTNIISPYRIPVWNELNRLLRGNFKVLFLAERDKNRMWKIPFDQMHFKWEIVPNYSFFIQKLDWGLYFNWGLLRKIKTFHPDVLSVTSYDALGFLKVIFYAKLSKTPLVIWHGGHRYSSRVKSGLLNLLRTKLFKIANMHIAYGTLAADRLRDIGIPNKNIIIAYNTVDTHKLAIKVKAIRKKQQRNFVNYIYVGQLVQRKGVRELLFAWKAVKLTKSHLLIVGDGELKTDLQYLSRKLNLSNVTFSGFVQPSNMPTYFAQSDVLVMPSLREVWGLVVNEGLASGCYVLASRYAGSTYDMIRSEKVGLIFDPADPIEFKKTLKKAYEHVKSMNFNREKSCSMGKSYNVETYALAIYKALYKSHNHESK